MIVSPTQIDIEWPLVALFHYIADIENNATWRSEVTHAEWLNRNESRMGCTYCEMTQVNGEEVELVYTVTEFVPYQKRTVTVGDVSFIIHFEALTTEWTRLNTTVIAGEGNSDHLQQLFFNELSKLKNMLEEVYC